MVGSVEAIAVMPAPGGIQDDLWLIVNRTINGVTRRYVEYLAPHYLTGDNVATEAFYSDSGSTYSGAPTTTVTGLSYLEGETVKVLVDGAVHPDCVVTGGQITLNWAGSNVQVGEPQTALLTTMPLEAGAPPGSTAQGKIKRVSGVRVRFRNTLGGQLGVVTDPEGDEVTDELDTVETRTPFDPLGLPPSVFNGFFPRDKKIMPWPGQYEQEAKLTYQNSDPTPATIVGIYPIVDVGEG